MLKYSQCEACSGIMFLTLVEPHHTKPHIDYRVFECSDCTAVEVLIVGDPIAEVPPPSYWPRRWRFENFPISAVA